jgi:hypothetical protein
VPKLHGVLCVIILASSVPHAIADIAAIRASDLPQETSVLAALDDARQMEPYSSVFTAPWNFDIAKDVVATRLGKDLGFLRAASQVHPDNLELLLLTGLVARYAYNVDVDGSYDTAMEILGRAEKLAPDDVRASWFRSTLECQTTQPKPGIDGFLAIEDNHAWDRLPAAFWDDYMDCALLTGLPAHVLRAASYLKQMNAPESQRQDFLTEVAQKRFDAIDPNKKYEPKEIWSGETTGEVASFTSTACGVRVRSHGDWQIDQMGFGNLSCVAVFSTGPYKATKHNLRPSILLIARPAKPGESLDDFLKMFLKPGEIVSPEAPSHCPAASCTAVEADQPKMYKADGDGRAHMIVFERDEPPFPGLLFESPWEMPKSDASAGMQYFRPKQTVKRMPGKLYYLVLLDTAASIEEPAMKDFDFFLENLTAE